MGLFLFLFLFRKYAGPFPACPLFFSGTGDCSDTFFDPNALDTRIFLVALKSDAGGKRTQGARILTVDDRGWTRIDHINRSDQVISDAGSLTAESTKNAKILTAKDTKHSKGKRHSTTERHGCLTVKTRKQTLNLQLSTPLFGPVILPFAVDVSDCLTEEFQGFGIGTPGRRERRVPADLFLCAVAPLRSICSARRRFGG